MQEHVARWRKDFKEEREREERERQAAHEARQRMEQAGLEAGRKWALAEASLEQVRSIAQMLTTTLSCPVALAMRVYNAVAGHHTFSDAGQRSGALAKFWANILGDGGDRGDYSDVASGFAAGVREVYDEARRAVEADTTHDSTASDPAA